MKIVIDLHDEVYNNMVVKNEYTDRDIIAVHNALMGAIIIPEGHGRIIDENKITTILFSEEKHWIDEKTGYHHFSPSIIRGTDAPTIIEADKGEQNGEEDRENTTYTAHGTNGETLEWTEED